MMILLIIINAVGLFCWLVEYHNDRIYARLMEAKTNYFHMMRQCEANSKVYDGLLKEESEALNYLRNRLWTWDRLKSFFRRCEESKSTPRD